MARIVVPATPVEMPLQLSLGSEPEDAPLTPFQSEVKNVVLQLSLGSEPEDAACQEK